MIAWEPEAISLWAEAFDRQRSDAVDLWKGIEVLAERYRHAVASKTDEDVAWQHLILAVGNFKRQSPIRVRPLTPTKSYTTLDEFTVPDTGASVGREDRWDGLIRHGIRTATATAILAALWPKEHMIFDEKVLHIGNALLVVRDKKLARPDPPFPEATMAAYAEALPLFRGISQQTGKSLQQLERASFMLSQRLGTQADRPWRRYIKDLNKLLSTPPVTPPS